MGLEDIAAMRAVHGSTVLYPCDANQTAQLMALMADRHGINYIRTTRQATPVIYGADEEFKIGGSRVLRTSEGDQLTIVGAGITVFEALEAADGWPTDGIAARVIDLYSVKPIDAATLVEAARATGHVLTVEDHWPEGGLGEAVFSALAEAGVAVARQAAGGAPHARLGHARGGARGRRHRSRSPSLGAAAKRLLGRTTDTAPGTRRARARRPTFRQRIDGAARARRGGGLGRAASGRATRRSGRPTTRSPA